jgi:hypothetical protein
MFGGLYDYMYRVRRWAKVLASVHELMGIVRMLACCVLRLQAIPQSGSDVDRHQPLTSQHAPPCALVAIFHRSFKPSKPCELNDGAGCAVLIDPGLLPASMEGPLEDQHGRVAERSRKCVLTIVVTGVRLGQAQHA